MKEHRIGGSTKEASSQTLKGLYFCTNQIPFIKLTRRFFLLTVIPICCDIKFLNLNNTKALLSPLSIWPLSNRPLPPNPKFSRSSPLYLAPHLYQCKRLPKSSIHLTKQVCALILTWLGIKSCRIFVFDS